MLMLDILTWETVNSSHGQHRHIYSSHLLFCDELTECLLNVCDELTSDVKGIVNSLFKYK